MTFTYSCHLSCGKMLSSVNFCVLVVTLPCHGRDFCWSPELRAGWRHFSLHEQLAGKGCRKSP